MFGAFYLFFHSEQLWRPVGGLIPSLATVKELAAAGPLA
jgi:hypothetical protein